MKTCFVQFQRLLLAMAVLVVLVMPGSAQNAPPALSQKELFDKLAALDHSLFASTMGAYGQCDLDKVASFFSEDVEFYHDQGGLTRTRAALLEQIKNVCGKQRRELVAGSLEAYPIPGYGAIQTGAHRFYHPQGSGEVGGTVIAKFLHVWQNQDGAWKITRVVSYAH